MSDTLSLIGGAAIGLYLGRRTDLLDDVSIFSRDDAKSQTGNTGTNSANSSSQALSDRATVLQSELDAANQTIALLRSELAAVSNGSTSRKAPVYSKSLGTVQTDAFALVYLTGFIAVGSTVKPLPLAPNDALTVSPKDKIYVAQRLAVNDSRSPLLLLACWNGSKVVFPTVLKSQGISATPKAMSSAIKAMGTFHVFGSGIVAHAARWGDATIYLSSTAAGSASSAAKSYVWAIHRLWFSEGLSKIAAAGAQVWTIGRGWRKKTIQATYYDPSGSVPTASGSGHLVNSTKYVFA